MPRLGCLSESTSEGEGNPQERLGDSKMLRRGLGFHFLFSYIIFDFTNEYRQYSQTSRPLFLMYCAPLKLNLDDNGIDDVGAMELARALASNNALRRVCYL